MIIVPIPSKIKTVAFGEIDIFLNDKVGILLTRSIATKTVKNGVKFFKL